MSTESNINVMELDLSEITKLQTRSEVRPDVVEELISVIKQEILIDPAIVIRDTRSGPPRLWLADGHHRLEAYYKLGRPTMPCRVQNGTRWDAIQIGLETNSKHVGERMSRADKEHAIRVVLKERPALADGAVAGLVGCDPKTVGKYRREMVAGKEIQTCDAREGLDGKIYQLASRRQAMATTSQCRAAKPDSVHMESDGSSSGKSFEPALAGRCDMSAAGGTLKCDEIAPSRSPTASSPHGEGNSLESGMDQRLSRISVISSGSPRDEGGSGLNVKSRAFDDFVKSQDKAIQHLGKMWKSVDKLTEISPNARAYQDFRTLAENISLLLTTWPPIPEGDSDATSPQTSQATNDDTDDF